MIKKNKEKAYSVAAIVIIIDQIIKFVISNKMSLEQEIEVIPKFFSLYYVKNTGAAFSILQNQRVLLIIISLVFLYFMDRFIEREKDLNKLSIISLGFIIGGIIGNLIDRLIQDGVIDYLLFQFGKYIFPIFNIADSFIIVGIVLLIIGIIKEEKEHKLRKIPIKERLSDQVEIIKVDKTKKKKVTKNDNSKKRNTRKTR